MDARSFELLARCRVLALGELVARGGTPTAAQTRRCLEPLCSSLGLERVELPPWVAVRGGTQRDVDAAVGRVLQRRGKNSALAPVGRPDAVVT